MPTAVADAPEESDEAHTLDANTKMSKRALKLKTFSNKNAVKAATSGLIPKEGVGAHRESMPNY